MVSDKARDALLKAIEMYKATKYKAQQVIINKNKRYKEKLKEETETEGQKLKKEKG